MIKNRPEKNSWRQVLQGSLLLLIDFDKIPQMVFIILVIAHMINNQTQFETIKMWTDEVNEIYFGLLKVFDPPNGDDLYALVILVVAMMYLVYPNPTLYSEREPLHLIYENPIEQFSFSVVSLIDYQNDFKNDYFNFNKPPHLDHKHKRLKKMMIT